MGVILPTPIGNEFHLTYESDINLSDFRFEIFHYKKVFERYFGEAQWERRENFGPSIMKKLGAAVSGVPAHNDDIHFSVNGQ